MARPRPRKSKSPLDEMGQKLADEQHRLEAQVMALQRELEEAPRRQAEEARQRREALVESARLERGVHRPRGGARSGGGRRYTPLLKAERRAARLKSLALFALLITLIIWLVTTYVL